MSSARQVRKIAWALLACPLIAASAPRDWKKVEPDLALSYPADHGAHPDYQTEWWYLTGQVEDESGARFGFQFTVFRNGLVAGPPEPQSSPLRARQLFFGHLAIVDLQRGQMHFAERARRGGTPLARAAETDLDVALDGWTLTRVSDSQNADGRRERLLLKAHDAGLGIGLEFELEPRKPLCLHGRNGFSKKGAEAGNASAYASWTRLAARGVLTVGGVARPVTGEAWFDHEYGSSVLGDGVVGWDWFGLQLDDGREVMLFGLRRADGSVAPASAGTLIEVDGTSRALAREDFEVEVEDHWRSPASEARYPSAWTIRVPDAALELELRPLVADCELASDGSTGVVYWEGPVAVSGSQTGRGYAELTGYAGSMSGRF